MKYIVYIKLNLFRNIPFELMFSNNVIVEANTIKEAKNKVIIGMRNKYNYEKDRDYTITRTLEQKIR